MSKLYHWTAKRAGAKITIIHSTGKVTGVDWITADKGKVYAVIESKRTYELICD